MAAMQLPTKSVKAGMNDRAHMKEDTDLNPLRGRDDFKNPLTELEKKYPLPKEVAPMPREKKRVN